MSNLTIRIATAIAFSIATACLALDVTVTNAPYNASGNGSTNDRVAIQNAINDVSAGGGGTVTLPAGRIFLSGTVELKSNVTLRILGELRSSTNTGDYPYETRRDRTFNPEQCAWDDLYHWNYPFIFIDSATHDVRVTGGGGANGTIRLGTNGTSDGGNIFMHVIGAYEASGITIDSVRIREGKGYCLMFHSSDHITINAINVDQPFNTGGDLNVDGISIEGCQNVRVSNSYLRVNDDIIYAWASYDDCRGRRWWSSRNPEPCRTIEVDHNTLVMCNNMYSPHSLTIINWGGCCPDQSTVHISNINFHDNILERDGNGTPIAFEFLGPDPMHGGCGWAPVSSFTWKNNVNRFNGPINDRPGGMTITDCDVDFGNTSYRSPTSFQNAGFENDGDPFWSRTANSNPKSSGAGNNAVGQSGSWYGFIDHLESGDTRIYQGLYLTPRNYTFAARVQSSGAVVRMFARNADNSIIRCQEFSNTGWATVAMPFTVSTAGNIRLGIERGTATTGWARIDDAALSIGGTGGTGCNGATSFSQPMHSKELRAVAALRSGSGQVMLSVAASGRHVISIVNGKGSAIKTFRGTGPHTYVVPAGGVSAGMYLLSGVADGNSVSERIVTP